MQKPDGHGDAALDSAIHSEEPRKRLGVPTVFGECCCHATDSFRALAVHCIQPTLGPVDSPLPPQQGNQSFNEARLGEPCRLPLAVKFKPEPGEFICVVVGQEKVLCKHAGL
ncbi:MAG: hypothetical protein NT154_14680 [Verrucomicrobia bacterium]|nr:hypothetical protein [Verrucomicrobiota bacterium]